MIDKQAGDLPFAFRLDPTSGVPTYQQIVRQVEDALRLGYLRAGDQLPKVKDVVFCLAINPNTVLKAYRELETKGLAAGRPGSGTFINGSLALVPASAIAPLRREFERWLDQAEAAGLDPEALAALVNRALQDHLEGRKRMSAS